MEKLKIVILLVISFLFTSSFVHEYYVSIANVNINRESNKLEVELKLDAEDFEKILSKEEGTRVNFDEIDKKEVEFVSSYLSKHFVVWINGGTTKARLIGEELNPDGDFWCYLVVDLPDVIQTIKIKNDLLLSVFLQQHNIVNIKENTRTQSHTFITKHTTHTFKIDAN